MKRKILHVALSILLLSGPLVWLLQVFEDEVSAAFGETVFMVAAVTVVSVFMASALTLFGVLFLAVGERAEEQLGWRGENEDGKD